MSAGTNHPRPPIANRSFVLSDSARRATARLSEPPRIELDSVRRNIETQYPRNEIESPNVVVEREFPFNNIDESLLVTEPTDSTDEIRREERQPRPRISRTPSNVSLRREFSLTSYESDTFDPEEVYRHLRGEMSIARTPPEYALTNTATDADQDVPRQAAHRLEQQNANTARSRRPSRREETDHTAILELLREMRTEMRTELHALHERVRQVENIDRSAPRRETNNGESSMAYGRSDRDIRHRHSTSPNFLSLKEARTMIPDFDGTSRHKLNEFMHASTYAVNNIDPANEESLIQAILCTKLKGKALQDFETRDIQTFEELKQQLEACYQTKQSVTHLQIEFNSLKQKANETAHAFGQRVDLLAMKLYASMIEGKEHPPGSKNVIQQTIKDQALINFQIGLREELQILVRAQRYATLQEAITGASAEEKLLGPTKTNQYSNRSRSESSYSRSTKCFKCGMNGHHGRDCRSGKNVLPKPEKPRVNVVTKFCSICKKKGHSRDECWSKRNRSGNKVNTPEHKKKSLNDSESDRKKQRHRKRDSESASSNSESEHEQAKQRQPRPALEYRVTHIKETTTEPQLLWTRIPIREAANRKVNMLYDSGSTISLIKLKQLRDDALIYENKIALTGITGHKIYTIGKMYATIELDGRRLKHAFYVIGDDTPIEREGILRIDFLRKHIVTCDYSNNRLQIGNAVLELHPFRKLILKPRSETIKATTSKNRVGIVRAEKVTSGVYIGNCLVNAEKYECPVSVINTTDKAVEITTPHVTIEEVEHDATTTLHTVQTNKSRKPTVPRTKRI